jgi:DNA-binding IclR family transcriptional regulator
MDQVLRAGLTRLTPHTLTSPRSLHGRVQRIASTGIAYEREETQLGWWCGAALVRAPAGTYAFGLVSPVSAVPMARGIAQLRRTAEHLQRELAAQPGRRVVVPAAQARSLPAPERPPTRVTPTRTLPELPG